MKQLRISAASNLLGSPNGDTNEYVRTVFRFYKEAGFDAVDLRLNTLDLTSDGWQPQVEQILKDSAE